MLKKTITYKDYNDVERTEDFYFNLNEAEMIEMELGKEGGLSEFLKKIVATKDQPELIKMFKDLVLKAYGEKSADGKRFVKSDEIAIAFSQTGAYPKLFMELATNAELAADFVKAIVPNDINK